MESDGKHDSLIETWASNFGVPAGLALAQSRAGADGLFQLTPATVLDLLKNNHDALRKVLALPEVNVILGTFHGAQLKRQFSHWFPAAEDQWKAAMAACHCGAGRVHEAINACAEAGKEVTVYENVAVYLPDETRLYAASIWAEFLQADNPET